LIETKKVIKVAQPISTPATKYVPACACHGDYEVGGYGGGDGGSYNGSGD